MYLLCIYASKSAKLKKLRQLFVWAFLWRTILQDMKKFRSIFNKRNISKKRNIDPFSIILTLMLIIIIPSFMTGDTTLLYQPVISNATTSQERNIYKDKLMKLTKEIASQPSSFTKQQKEISAALVPDLFDITLNLDSAILNKSGDLVSRTEFVSFGTRPTLVSLEYSIQNAAGKEVYHENDQVIVETEKIISKQFTNLNIKGGKYALVLTTTYGENVRDEFKQKFEVKGFSNSIKIILIATTIIFVASAIIYNNIRFLRRKKR